MRLLPLAAAGVAALLTAGVTTSCKEDAKIDTAEVSAGDVPTMMTRNVETLISDSGVTRYRINTPLWYMYDEVKLEKAIPLKDVPARYFSEIVLQLARATASSQERNENWREKR